MNYFFVTSALLAYFISLATCEVCDAKCPPSGELTCTFNAETKIYKMFPNKCAIGAYIKCHNVNLIETELKYCVKADLTQTRRMYGESCPVFCPNYYRPVCGASKLRDYVYRTFNNGCYLDMVSCRGDDDAGYVEVPLEFCQRHAMKNIFKEQVIVSNLHDYQD